ncbi:MAG: nucleotidyltransferase substrate binding protein [Bdellovibrionales bacterium]|nr:nucleotidyltransferase substrate binding protein [Bdellovibrionales bacterium]
MQLQELAKAVQRLGDALAQPKNEYLRDSVIQRFEFCVELAWKTARRVMGSGTSAPKDVIREMAQSAYISDVDQWLRAIDIRNLPSHTYREDIAETVYDFASRFHPELQRLASALDRK